MFLSNVITFQGSSIGKLKEASTDSGEDYLDFCAGKGKTPEKASLGALMFTLPLSCIGVLL